MHHLGCKTHALRTGSPRRTRAVRNVPITRRKQADDIPSSPAYLLHRPQLVRRQSQRSPRIGRRHTRAALHRRRIGVAHGVDPIRADKLSLENRRAGPAQARAQLQAQNDECDSQGNGKI